MFSGRLASVLRVSTLVLFHVAVRIVGVGNLSAGPPPRPSLGQTGYFLIEDGPNLAKNRPIYQVL